MELQDRYKHGTLLKLNAWLTNNWKDKLRIWLMPTGWRPADVAEKYPLHKINDPYSFQKYDTKASPALHVWSWVQMTAVLLFISYLFGNIAAINKLNSTYIYIYGLFIFLSVYAFTELMDRHKYAAVWETIKNIFGLGIIFQTGDWFGASQHFIFLKYVLGVYFILSTLVTVWFVLKHAKEDGQMLMAV
jgi:alkylglycerol monooxygenase